MNEIIVNLLNEYGYLGVCLLIFVENIFPPIPSEVVLAFGGFMTTHTQMNVWLVAIYSTLGSYLGACVLYGIGRFLNKDRLINIVSGKVGKHLHIKPEHIEKADSWFENHGYPTVFFCRFIPIVRSLISIPAGMTKMPFYLFSILTLFGSAIWNIVLIWAGRISGNAWETCVEYFGMYSEVAVCVFAVICIVLFIIYKMKKRKKYKE